MHDRGEGRASFGMCRNLMKVSLALGDRSATVCLSRIGCISQLRCFIMTNLKLSSYSNTIELFRLE